MACRIIALAAIMVAAACHIGYLAWHCPIDLSADEAHYWEWSRHLDWSYYSKGPLVAYLIRAGTALAGAWSENLIGSEMLAVRLPAVLCGSLLLLSLFVLTVQVYGSERMALAVVLAALTLPPLAAGASIMTIDAPYTCCWGWALVLGYQATVRRSAWAWSLAGLIIGLGILAKYTMVLFIPSLALFLLTSRAHRRLLLKTGFWIMTGIAAVCCLPILVWNARHGWVTFHHVHGLAGLEGESAIHWLGPLNYIGVQAALLLGYWFIAWLAAIVANRPWREVCGCHGQLVCPCSHDLVVSHGQTSCPWHPGAAERWRVQLQRDVGCRYLWWLSAPMFVVFGAFAFKTGGGEPNWPITAYLSGMVLAVDWLSRQLRSPRLWYRRLAWTNLAIALALGLALTIVMHHGEWLYPTLARWTGSPRPDNPTPLRRFDPTARLRGWRELCAHVDELRNQLRADGIEPELAGTSWSVPGELAFYCAGHPSTYSLGLALGDRHSQYDFWHPNPFADASCFRGKTFIVVGDFHPALRAAFDHVEPSEGFVNYQGGYPLGCWMITVCRGFRGFGEAPSTPAF